MAEEILEEIEEKTGEPERIDPAPKKKASRLKRLFSGKKKLFITLFIVLMVLGGSGFGAWYFLFRPAPEQAVEELPETAITEDQVQAAIDKNDEAIFDDIVILAPFDGLKLKGTSAMGRINLTICLELIDPNDRRLFYPMEERIRKIVEGQMQELTWLELRMPEGKIRLKYELLQHINGVFNKPMIRNLYFTNFIMR